MCTVLSGLCCTRTAVCVTSRYGVVCLFLLCGWHLCQVGIMGLIEPEWLQTLAALDPASLVGACWSRGPYTFIFLNLMLP